MAPLQANAFYFLIHLYSFIGHASLT